MFIDFFTHSYVAILPHMVSQKSGSIVFIGSVAGFLAIPFRSSFAASKHALQAFCDVLRAEIAMHNIKVLVSNPEYYPTEVYKGDIDGNYFSFHY